MNPGVLARLADRWRAAGIFLAYMSRDGSLQWHDSQMPRLLSLCVTSESTLNSYIRSLPEIVELSFTAHYAPLPGIDLYLVPLTKRRRVIGWLAVLARTDAAIHSEELQRMASKRGLDATALVSQLDKLPLVHKAALPALAAIAGQMHEDLTIANVTTAELSSVTGQLSSVYEEISLLYKISSGMRFSQKPEAFLSTVCAEVQELANLRCVSIATVNLEDDCEEPDIESVAASVGHCGFEGMDLVTAMKVPIRKALLTGEAVVCNDLLSETDAAHLRPHVSRYVIAPLMRGRRPLGVLISVDKLDHQEFNSVDLKLLLNVANQCSIFIENAALYRDMQGLFMGVLHALTRSIDAKDAYTRGHSQRVAELSRSLAQKIGLPEEQCERIYLSGLLHDVGKIGVPEAVLTKPGRLTEEEFAAIKKHPEIGAQILGSIRQLQDIIPGVLYHHERWDGRGYPYRIAGDAIPLMGRIICVADSFDAMGSTRTYRAAMSPETVLAEIARCGGTQFDPQLAAVFVKLDFSSYLQAVKEQTVAANTSATGAA